MKDKLYLYIIVGTILVRYLLIPFFDIHPNLILLLETLPFILSAILLYRVAVAHAKPYKSFWLLLSLGSLFFATANVTWVVYEIWFSIEAPIPSISDIFWSLQNITYVTALVYLLMRDRSIYRSIRFLFDTAIVLITAGALSWEFIIFPYMDYFFNTTSLWGVLVTTIYPVTDLAMLMCIFMLYYTNRFPYSKQVFMSIIAGMIVFILGDTLYLSQVIYGTYAIGSWIDPLFNITVLLLAYAGVRSTQTKLRTVSLAQKKETSTRKIKYVLPYSCLIMLLALTVQRFELITADLIIIASLVTILLIIVRQVIVLQENDTLMLKLQEALQRAEYLALYDPLSKLPNRRYFEMHATKLIERSKGNESENNSFALLFLDLDRFKFVNDSYGHDVGDALIEGVAERISSLADERHFISRMGGDEMTVLFQGYQSEEELMQFSHRIIAEVGRPFQFGDIQFEIGVSIGISIYHQDGVTVTELLKNADVALYQAKALGKGRAVFYSNPFIKNKG
ncbi:GGDEF domain-containing protein [Bacillus horti]|uniref:Diguanylate cyclase (GGDEF)-like protein n=2 Tax=Caldalkalibacillus horti TaxID=77523 RepID=A0ABT9W1S3_9BACI|nr:GGDEF domain-containing protein [Bacillus horti]MDQ0167171.1 diguanylate cyclase (GGDEF)-like protein [Bacillus horti]